MTDHTVNVAALIGSRICHDLISPVGAVTNGLELLAMSGVSDSPELALVNNSAADASARIRLFRLAFGAASEEQRVSGEEMQRILSDHYSDGRINVNWHPQNDMPRKTAQAVILAVMCIEQTLPFGGQMNIYAENNSWAVTAKSERIRQREDLWAGLQGDAPLPELAPADVQYFLLHELLGGMGRECTIIATETEVSLRF